MDAENVIDDVALAGTVGTVPGFNFRAHELELG